EFRFPRSLGRSNRARWTRGGVIAMSVGQLDLLLGHFRILVGVAEAEAVSDAELLERFLAHRDETAFAVLVQRHGPLVLGVCRRQLRHAQDAEDAFQAAFLTLAKKAASIRNKESLAAWLYEVAYHIAVRLRAQAARRKVELRQVPDMS